MARTVGILSLVAIAVFGIGWLIGGSGRSDLEQQRRASEARAAFAEARAHLFEGRVSLYQLNFGAASQQFDRARSALEALQALLREAGSAERAGQLEVAIARVRAAQQMAVSMDPNAQSAAEEALRAIEAAK
jgi:hypothetical protein